MNDTADDADFIALTSKISRERGFDAANYKDTCMRRRIAVRMRARGAEDYATYSRLLDSDPVEYEWLIAALTVNVTKSIRNPEAWVRRFRYGFARALGDARAAAQLLGGGLLVR